MKGQCLRWLVEGQPGLAEERVDEVEPSLDGPEAAVARGVDPQSLTTTHAVTDHPAAKRTCQLTQPSGTRPPDLRPVTANEPKRIADPCRALLDEPGDGSAAAGDPRGTCPHRRRTFRPGSVLAVFLVLISAVEHEFVVREEVLIAVREPDVNSERQFLSDNPDSLRAPVHDLLAYHRISHDAKLSVGHIDLVGGIEGGAS